MRQPKQLTVYRASAGSGKTFTLAIRFIELLIKNPTAYREILAVTFTNKATEEMKTRILSQLYGIGHSLPDSDSYLKKIMEDLGIPEKEVRQSSMRALSYIIHDYSNFNVETIDAFFQRVLRNLARELELTANLRVELDQNEVEEMAVDKLIAELKANDKVLRWIISYIEQQMTDEKGWNVIGNIKDFGMKIFEQAYKDNADALNQKLEREDFFESYQRNLRAIVAEADQKMQAYGKEFFSRLAAEGYTVSDLSNGTRGAASYFQKLLDKEYTVDDGKIFNKRAQDAYESYKGWLTKASLEKPIACLARDFMTPLLQQAEKERKERARLVRSARVILSNLNELRLLQNIEQTVAEMNKDAGRFLLTDTQNVLNELMKDSDAPFVFEKIGGRISHTMIDEFQDTSVIQWSNFKKLLKECLSHRGSENLIVGDVKQSIYRWRNGDWRLLNNINNDPDLKGKDIAMEQLNVNYRSERNIITFNNKFFCLAAGIEQNVLQEDGNGDSAIVGEIYSCEGVEQRFPANKAENGLVDITLLPRENYSEDCRQLTKQYIETLIEEGARDEDIAIIVRGNADICSLANWLQAEMPDHTFVSDDAFRLDASVAVGIIVDAMKALASPKDNLILAQLAKEYQSHILGAKVSEVEFREEGGIARQLPEGFTHDRERLLAMSLNDMAESISSLFKLETLAGEAAYINAFFDQIDSFTKTSTPDLEEFLEAWEDTICSKAVKGGDLSGIRLLTIHKSKGLEFDHVIVPYCNWELHKSSTLWCTTEEMPFGEMPIVPVDSKKIKDTIYSKDYHEEMLQSTIDNLNMLYVAFTRAGKNLFVIGKNVLGKNGIAHTHRSGLLQAILPKLAEVLPGSTLSGDTNNKDEELHFTFGSLYVSNSTKKTSDNVFLSPSTDLEVDIIPHSRKVTFCQSNRSRLFINGEDEEQGNLKYITQGAVMHCVLSQIHDASEVDRVLGDFLQEGVISDGDDTMNRQTLSELLRKRIEENENPLVNRWFSPEVKVLNECSILSWSPTDGKAMERRPDRIVLDGEKITVVDFKFGNSSPKYPSQVRGYMHLLRDMGYENVDGYLWYVYTNKIEKISSEETSGII